MTTPETETPLPSWSCAVDGKGLLVLDTAGPRVHIWAVDDRGAPFHADGLRALGLDWEVVTPFVVLGRALFVYQDKDIGGRPARQLILDEHPELRACVESAEALDDDGPRIGDDGEWEFG